MDSIVTLAIVGTGQAGKDEIATGTPIDALTTQLSGTLERKLLLAAGARSIYQQAGKLAATAPDAPVPAEPESLAPTVFNTYLLAQLLNEHNQLLLEAAERMQRAHLRLPHELLPAALTAGVQAKEVRAALAPILGKRSRWLAQFNPAWSWITQYLEDTNETLPENAETLWQEGTQGQRSEILHRLRANSPAKARQWLEEVWKQEKAETKVAFLKTFETGLSLEDEPFLEQALDDRSSTTRTNAASLLALLPTSALTQRMQERADKILNYENESLLVIPPLKNAINQEWKRDGINADQAHGTGTQGERAVWLKQVLTLVPPHHWEERFHATPTQLINAVSKSEWALEVIENWANATLRYNDTQWIAPLLDQLHHRAMRNSSSSIPEIEKALLSILPQQDAEEVLMRSIPDKQARWTPLLTALPHPWSEKFSIIYLNKMREYVRTLPQYNHQLIATLTTAAFALPTACFDAALLDWEEPEEAKRDWTAHYWQKEVAKFTEILLIRKRIIEEIV